MVLIHLFPYLIEAASFYTSEELLKTFTYFMLNWLLGDVFGKGIMSTAQRYKWRLVSTPFTTTATTAVTTAAYLFPGPLGLIRTAKSVCGALVVI